MKNQKTPFEMASHDIQYKKRDKQEAELGYTVEEEGGIVLVIILSIIFSVLTAALFTLII